ncbi:hypothetical protein M8494_18575 [Serratia ureilytica]
MPGDRFSESGVAQRMAASRAPVRQALFRLELRLCRCCFAAAGRCGRRFAYFEAVRPAHRAGTRGSETAVRMAGRETPAALATLNRFGRSAASGGWPGGVAARRAVSSGVGGRGGQRRRWRASTAS